MKNRKTFWSIEEEVEVQTVERQLSDVARSIRVSQYCQTERTKIQKKLPSMSNSKERRKGAGRVPMVALQAAGPVVQAAMVVGWKEQVASSPKRLGDGVWRWQARKSAWHERWKPRQMGRAAKVRWWKAVRCPVRWRVRVSFDLNEGRELRLLYCPRNLFLLLYFEGLTCERWPWAVQDFHAKPPPAVFQQDLSITHEHRTSFLSR